MDTNKGTTDLGTLIGLLAGLGIILIGIIQSGGKLYWFFNFNSLLIVLGGTFAATMVNLPLRAVGNIFNVLQNVFRGEDYDYAKLGMEDEHGEGTGVVEGMGRSMWDDAKSGFPETRKFWGDALGFQEGGEVDARRPKGFGSLLNR